ncbi:hypothetical protein Ancab_018993 [Ancistrocladus abbreviatus]
MPPSPSLRRSPVREPRTDSHKRGRSLENGLSFKEKDEDLALFNEMQSRERENFLLQSTDDFEDIFSTKLKPFPDLKLGITIPVRGEGSDLLNADGDKNDYDWLLTPPETPLFPSLDDELAPVNLVHGGRPRSRPISISRSSTMEKSYRSSRGSASPQRLSPSPRSGNSTFTLRGRPSSAPHSSPTPSLWHSTPSRRPSPPPIKPSTPPPRSATPTPRRPSTGSGSTNISLGLRGTSPVRTSRGNSASPKIRAWQSNIPGFSLEAPPNLRTSLADRPASYLRGSSPASRNSRDSSAKFGRQSMSPTASRSISSSHSHERDRLSSHSKGSIASFGDDDVDSLQSIPIASSEQSVPRRVVSGFPSNRPLTYSKKPLKGFSPNSAPKKSFDSAMRQMDRRSPQNMFRPLLSSVPSTTFYSGKASSYRSMISRNSSVTTSSNASSDQATSGAPDTEGSDQNQDDVASEYRRGTFVDIQDEVFAFDKIYVASEGTGREIQKRLPHIQVGEHKDSEFASNQDEFEELRHHAAAVATDTSEGLYTHDDPTELGSDENTLHCSRCGCRYPVTELVESEFNICPECKLKEELSTAPTLVTGTDVFQDSSDKLVRNPECRPIEAGEPVISVLELPDTVDMDGSRSALLTASPEEEVGANQSSYGEPRQSCFLDDSPPASMGKESMQMLSDQQEVGQPARSFGPSDSAYQDQESTDFCSSPLPKVDATEGAGISVLLLKRCSSSKGPIMQSRNITVSAISYEDSCYARDSTTSMRSSTGHGSASTSSSIDLTSVRHAETRMQRQLSSTRSDMSLKPQSNGSFFLGTSTNAFQGLGMMTNTCEENVELSVQNLGRIVGETPETSFALENSELTNAAISIARATPSEEDNCHSNVSSKCKDADTLELSSNTLSSQSEDNSLASLAFNEDHILQGIPAQLAKSVLTVANMEESTVISDSSGIEGCAMPADFVDQMEVAEILDHNSLAVISEKEIDDFHPCCQASQTEAASKDELQERAAMSSQDKEVVDSVLLSSGSDHMHGIVEESMVMVDQGGRRTRSLTLEEATDTILFCSSIVHNLAYEAASIAIDKEKENLVPLEVPRPVVTVLGKPNPKDSSGRTPSKRTGKSQKPKERCVETEMEPPSSKTETDDKPMESTTRIVGLPNKVDGIKPPKLESKCNCTIM